MDRNPQVLAMRLGWGLRNAFLAVREFFVHEKLPTLNYLSATNAHKRSAAFRVAQFQLFTLGAQLRSYGLLAGSRFRFFGHMVL